MPENHRFGCVSNFPIVAPIVAGDRTNSMGGVECISTSNSFALIRSMRGEIKIKIKNAIRNMNRVEFV